MAVTNAISFHLRGICVFGSQESHTEHLDLGNFGDIYFQASPFDVPIKLSFKRIKALLLMVIPHHLTKATSNNTPRIFLGEIPSIKMVELVMVKNIPLH